MSSRIELTDVGQTFWVRGNDDKQLREFVALDGLNLTVAAGEFLTIVGPSGCGKSTILDLIAGLATPSGGQLTVDHIPISGPGLDRSV
ncbi:MAG TPA: ATP-binding cassette domain-containing protein, partial [Pseudolysinimonas sp.]|nr:ATP-binding cassette domain-containing protein [Pseudolysinimonas sp.]